jgi:hypothetical protein
MTTEVSWFDFWQGQENFLFFVVTGLALGTHPASHPMGTGAYFSSVKRLEPDADNSSPSSAEIKYAPFVFVTRCLSKHRNSLYQTDIPNERSCLIFRCGSQVGQY